MGLKVLRADTSYLGKGGTEHFQDTQLRHDITLKCVLCCVVLCCVVLPCLVYLPCRGSAILSVQHSFCLGLGLGLGLGEDWQQL